jgi:Domain of unknown function (DUF4190)
MTYPPPPPPPGYRQDAYVSTGTNGMAVASMVLGIVGLVLCCLWIPEVLAIIFGGVALSQINNNPAQSGRGMAIAGLIMGIASFVIIVLIMIFGRLDYTVR